MQETTLPLPPIDLGGRTLAERYRIGAIVGQGGVAAIYEADDLVTGRRVAVKVLLPTADTAARERFAREAGAARLLAHPNIVEVLATIAEPEALVMELVRGPSLRDLIARGELTARRTLVLARQILEGLGHAHARGVVHRDLKPDNIRIVTLGEPPSTFERVKLLDFGLVKLLGDTTKLTETGLVFGTPAYMAPEQALGEPVDARADLYAAGVVLFEMLTGRPPFRSPDPMTTVRMQASAPPPTLASVSPGRPWCTPALEQLVARALVKQPADRFATADAMIEALDTAFVSLDHLPP